MTEAEDALRRYLYDSTPVLARRRAALNPVVGNVGEAVVESLLVDLGWQPLHDDTKAVSFSHGVDLLMLDPTLTSVFAIEVKTTTQRRRWPRLPRASPQLEPAWLDGSGNLGMIDHNLKADDVYLMLAQVQLHRRLWRVCLGPTGDRLLPVVTESQLEDLAWL